jgi:putative GTP pyrophosphokinase
MTEDEFLARWDRERPMYEAWGQFVSNRIADEIRPRVAPLSTDLFIRIPIKARVKSDGSFITKAFYRGKDYANPFDDITDTRSTWRVRSRSKISASVTAP